MKADLIFVFFLIAAIVVAGAAMHSRRDKHPPVA